MADGAQKHPYHLVDPSPWPALGALGAFLLAFGAAIGMHPDLFKEVLSELFKADTANALSGSFQDFFKSIGWWIVTPGFLIVFAVMYWWWSDVIVESRTYHTPVVQIGLRYGMILFIASEVLFFTAFFWAFFDSSIYHASPEMPGRMAADGAMWPPKGVTVIAPFDLPFMNTLILLLSGTTVTWAHHAILQGNQRDAVRGLAITVILGLCFTSIQAFEYAHAPFKFDDNIYSSTFFMATGFHGFHVMVGTIFLLVCLFRAMKGQFKPDQHFGFEAAAWYWHFVDVVWLFLFFCIYWWGSGNAPIEH
jgi:cytochrome c oxidase subunit 3